MKNFFFITTLLLILFMTAGCEDEQGIPDSVLKNRELIITNDLLSSDFVGNGAQWGGYDLTPEWLDSPSLSEADWNTLYERIDFMRPPFLRIITSPSWAYDNGGVYDETSKTASLFKMLDYAQSRNIEVVFGEWGHSSVDGNLAHIDSAWIDNSVKFLDYLVNTKGYSCIKTVNIINEPNGSWSSTEGDYDIWKNVQDIYWAEMLNYDLASIKLMGPDVAIFNSTSEADWITRAKNDLDEKIGMYDIHVYPSQVMVRNGDYTDMLQAYRDATPADKRIVLGEIGFKYSALDSTLQLENLAAIEADPFAGDDSNMKIYEAFYGVDMADALIQSMLAGFSGALVWGMDDAMYNFPVGDDYKTDLLKRWGFWNILGEEHCNDAQDEEIRPFFYPVSLLCRYFPAGSNIYNIELSNKKGVRAIMGEKEGKYTIALVNSHYTTYPIVLKSEVLADMTMDMYRYKSLEDAEFIGTTDDNGFATPEANAKAMNFEEGINLELEGESFLLFTNMQ